MTGRPLTACISPARVSPGLKTGSGGVDTETKHNQDGQSYGGAAGTGSGGSSSSGHVDLSEAGGQLGGGQGAQKQVGQASSNAHAQSALKGYSTIKLRQHAQNKAQLGGDDLQRLTGTENSVPGPVIAPVPVTGPVGVPGGALGGAPIQW